MNRQTTAFVVGVAVGYFLVPRVLAFARQAGAS